MRQSPRQATLSDPTPLTSENRRTSGRPTAEALSTSIQPKNQFAIEMLQRSLSHLLEASLSDTALQRFLQHELATAQGHLSDTQVTLSSQSSEYNCEEEEPISTCSSGHGSGPIPELSRYDGLTPNNDAGSEDSPLLGRKSWASVASHDAAVLIETRQDNVKAISSFPKGSTIDFKKSIRPADLSLKIVKFKRPATNTPDTKVEPVESETKIDKNSVKSDVLNDNHASSSVVHVSTKEKSKSVAERRRELQQQKMASLKEKEDIRLLTQREKEEAESRLLEQKQQKRQTKVARLMALKTEKAAEAQRHKLLFQQKMETSTLRRNRHIETVKEKAAAVVEHGKDVASRKHQTGNVVLCDTGSALSSSKFSVWSYIDKVFAGRDEHVKLHDFTIFLETLTIIVKYPAAALQSSLFIAESADTCDFKRLVACSVLLAHTEAQLSQSSLDFTSILSDFANLLLDVLQSTTAATDNVIEWYKLTSKILKCAGRIVTKTEHIQNLEQFTLYTPQVLTLLSNLYIHVIQDDSTAEYSKELLSYVSVGLQLSQIIASLNDCGFFVALVSSLKYQTSLSITNYRRVLRTVEFLCDAYESTGALITLQFLDDPSTVEGIYSFSVDILKIARTQKIRNFETSATHGDSFKIINQTLMFLGLHLRSQPAFSAVFRFGQCPTLLESLTALPFEYFNNPKLMDYLLPVLILSAISDDDNFIILRNEISLDHLVRYISQSKKPHKLLTYGSSDDRLVKFLEKCSMHR